MSDAAAPRASPDAGDTAAAASEAPHAAATAAHKGHAPGSTVMAVVALRQAASFATAGTDGDICVWAPSAPPDGSLGHVTASYGCVQRLCNAHAGEVRCLAVLSGGHLLSGGWDATLRLWAPGSAAAAAGRGEPRFVLEPAAVWGGHDGPIWALAPLRDGGAASAGADATVRLWPAPTAAASGEAALPVVPRRVLYGHTEDVCALAPLSCGARLASGGTDGTVRVWRLSDGALEAVLRGHSDSVTALAPTRGGGVASASADRAVRVWRALPPAAAPTGETPPQPLPHPAAPPPNPPPAPLDVVACVLAPLRCFFPQLPLPGIEAHGHRGAQGCAAVLQGHAQALGALAALPDGRVASGGADAALCVWSQAAAPPHGAPPSPRVFDPSANAGVAPPEPHAPWRCDRVLQRPDSAGATAAMHRPVAAMAALSYAPEAPALLLAVAFGARVRVWDVAASDVAAEFTTSRDQ